MSPSPSARASSDSRTRLLRHALNVLECLLHEPRSLGISEVAARLARPKSTTFRILGALVELGMVRKDEATRRYSLSSRVFGFVHELTLHFGPIGRFSHVLRKEAERLRASVYVSTLSGGFTYVVAASGALGDSFALGGQAVIRDVQTPEPRPGEVLVRTAFSTASAGTELLILRKSEAPDATDEEYPGAAPWEDPRFRAGIPAPLRPRRPVPGLISLGYSLAGTVIGVGEGVTDLRPGDRVACSGSQ